VQIEVYRSVTTRRQRHIASPDVRSSASSKSRHPQWRSVLPAPRDRCHLEECHVAPDRPRSSRRLGDFGETPSSSGLGIRVDLRPERTFCTIGYRHEPIFPAGNPPPHVVNRGSLIGAVTRQRNIRRQDSRLHAVNMGISFIPLIVVTMVLIIAGSFGCAVGKRNTMGDDIANNIDYPDYSPKYDESFPVSKETLIIPGLIRTNLSKSLKSCITSVASSSHLCT